MVIYLLALILNSAHAEYRVFELVINDSTNGQERVVFSTLDPRQFRAYYPVKYTEQVTYRSTWMCRGNTAGKPLCPQPENKKSSPVPTAPTPSLDQKSKS